MLNVVAFWKKIRKENIKPETLLIIFHFATYLIPGRAMQRFGQTIIDTKWDRAIPLIPAFLIIYIAAFAQWAIYYLRFLSLDRKTFRRFFVAELIAKTAATLCFMFFRVAMVRPVITGTDIFSRFLAFIYSIDAPVCFFPSYHCLQSWYCTRQIGVIGNKKEFLHSLLFTLLVFASTLFVKQHLIIDVPGGFLFAEISLWISRFLLKGVEEKEETAQDNNK